jgi:hypothetical protein
MAAVSRIDASPPRGYFAGGGAGLAASRTAFSALVAVVLAPLLMMSKLLCSQSE